MTTTATALKYYTKKEAKEVYELYYVNEGTSEEKQALAERLGRDLKSLANKAMNEKLKKAKKIEVVHINQKSPITTPAIITLGDVKIEVPSNSITINGTQLSW